MSVTKQIELIAADICDNFGLPGLDVCNGTKCEACWEAALKGGGQDE